MSEHINVKTIRGELSQARFAEILGVTQPTVCRWENGKAPRGAAKRLLEEYAKQLMAEHNQQ
jgi:DNA-binding transcriptional regulator YiaG